MTYKEIIECLHDLKDEEKIAYRAKKFGINSTNSLGISQKELNMIAKEIGKDNELAIQLFDSGIYEGRILCSKTFNPKDLTEELMEKWVKTFENWEICDSFCMILFSKSKFAVPKIYEWSKRESEFEKRAAFATIASLCMSDKKSNNEFFEQFFPLIKREANDDRLYVKKAVNWSLRNLGKRNIDLHRQAIEISEEILEFESKPAKWIANNALTELTKEKLRMSDYPRDIYRTNTQLK